ncbi:MAG: hypothetical protein KDD44_06465, partial [Bdellovibrionales bacterium]|nr:hypothetical protein [Bdellovibrionales bacterium]
MERWIRIRGARVHNLQSVDVDLPRDQITVVTGPSGSGKSSLAFHTLYAEAERRFIECLSSQARAFLAQRAAPAVDSISGLSPALAVSQQQSAAGDRATVGTLSEIYDTLRVLFATCGVPSCPNCGIRLERYSAEEITQQLLDLAEGTRVQLAFRRDNDASVEPSELLATIRQEGYVRVRTHGAIVPLEDIEASPPDSLETLDVIVDRLQIKPEIRPRLHSSVETCLAAGNHSLVILVEDESGGWSERVVSDVHRCSSCGFDIGPLEPALFSFNHPLGACTRCEGRGRVEAVSAERVVPDESKTLDEGAIVPLGAGQPLSEHARIELDTFVRAAGFDRTVPWRTLTPEARQLLLHGEQDA